MPDCILFVSTLCVSFNVHNQMVLPSVTVSYLHAPDVLFLVDSLVENVKCKHVALHVNSSVVYMVYIVHDRHVELHVHTDIVHDICM